MKSYCLIIQMKATGQYIYFPVVLFIMTCKTFGPMNEITNTDEPLYNSYHQSEFSSCWKEVAVTGRFSIRGFE